MTEPARSRTYIASDIHLGAVPDGTERAFRDFLGCAGRDADRLILCGDLFDFWFEYGPVIIGRHYRVLAALADLVDAGVAVTLVGGNHDAWGGRFLREEVGVEFHPDGLRTVIDGSPALVVHGDGVGAGDLKYRMLKTVIRSRAAVTAFRMLHPELGLGLARAVSSTEAKADRPELTAERARRIEEWACERLEADADLGWVVCGHAHQPSVREVEPGRWYINAGDWVRNATYILIEDGRPSLRRWPDHAARS